MRCSPGCHHIERRTSTGEGNRRFLYEPSGVAMPIAPKNSHLCSSISTISKGRNAVRRPVFVQVCERGRRQRGQADGHPTPRHDHVGELTTERTQGALIGPTAKMGAPPCHSTFQQLSNLMFCGMTRRKTLHRRSARQKPANLSHSLVLISFRRITEAQLGMVQLELLFDAQFL